MMDSVFRRLRDFHTEESRQHGLLFRPNNDDVFVTTYPKCGTTWMSFICHCLRTRGDTSFGEITEVVPWTIVALDCGQDLNAQQMASPRLFKSHESYTKIPKGGKYIYCARDPATVCQSFFEFLHDFTHIDRNSVTIEEFVDTLFAGKGSNSGRIWDHFLSFYLERKNPNVLWVFYEDLLEKERFEVSVRAVASFMDIHLDDELLEIVKDKCAFAAMKSMESKFDDHFVFDCCKERMGFPPDAQVRSTKVNKGGARQELSGHIRTILDERWREIIAESNGPVSYDKLREELSVTVSY